MKKKLWVILLTVLAVLSLTAAMCVSLAGCVETEPSADEKQLLLYEQYVNVTEAAGGQPMTYDEWLASIKGEKGDKGEKGEKGDKGDKGDPGKDGVDGKDGADGKDGVDGKDGADGKDGVDGKDGATWLTGKGVPANESGKEGDLYLDLTTYDIYLKGETTWDKIGNIRGGDASVLELSLLSSDYPKTMRQGEGGVGVFTISDPSLNAGDAYPMIGSVAVNGVQYQLCGDGSGELLGEGSELLFVAEDENAAIQIAVTGYRIAAHQIELTVQLSQLPVGDIALAIGYQNSASEKLTIEAHLQVIAPELPPMSGLPEELEVGQLVVGEPTDITLELEGVEEIVFVSVEGKDLQEGTNTFEWGTVRYTCKNIDGHCTLTFTFHVTSLASDFEPYYSYYILHIVVSFANGKTETGNYWLTIVDPESEARGARVMTELAVKIQNYLKFDGATQAKYAAWLEKANARLAQGGYDGFTELYEEVANILFVSPGAILTTREELEASRVAFITRLTGSGYSLEATAIFFSQAVMEHMQDLGSAYIYFIGFTGDFISLFKTLTASVDELCPPDREEYTDFTSVGVFLAAMDVLTEKYGSDAKAMYDVLAEFALTYDRETLMDESGNLAKLYDAFAAADIAYRANTGSADLFSAAQRAVDEFAKAIVDFGVAESEARAEAEARVVIEWMVKALEYMKFDKESQALLDAWVKKANALLAQGGNEGFEELLLEYQEINDSGMTLLTTCEEFEKVRAEHVEKLKSRGYSVQTIWAFYGYTASMHMDELGSGMVYQFVSGCLSIYDGVSLFYEVLTKTIDELFLEYEIDADPVYLSQLSMIFVLMDVFDGSDAKAIYDILAEFALTFDREDLVLMDESGNLAKLYDAFVAADNTYQANAEDADLFSVAQKAVDKLVSALVDDAFARAAAE